MCIINVCVHMLIPIPLFKGLHVKQLARFAERERGCAEAAQFKEEYEKAMDANGKLLAADVAKGGEEVPAVKDEAKAATDSAADALADEVAKADV